MACFCAAAAHVAKDYPEITYGEHIVDNTCMQLVMNPYQYDMLVMENLYGDILSDLCAAFVGGLGFVPSANLGDECAIFEAVHGSAPDIAGKNLANPTALLRSALLMVRHLGEHEASTQIRNALERVYRHPEKLTRDIGGKAGTSEFADAVIEEMSKASSASPDRFRACAPGQQFCNSAIDSHARFGVHCLRSGDSGEMTRTARRVGIVLFQLGGPDTLEAIEPFLYNLFCDPDIIDFPFARIGRKPLAKLISTTRARKVQHHYATIGGGSPIRRHTERQARALETELRKQGLDARCFVAMRYWHPFTHEAIQQLQASQCDEVVLLPLYPQYSSTTTGSSLNEWRRLFSR